MNLRKFLTPILCLLSTFFANAQPTFIADSIDLYINKGLKDWQLPGLAVVIVKDGKVVLQKGYGIKNIKTNDKVDENTLFFIASNSKLFTGTSLANLEYEKKLSLNDKITKYFPWYKLYDKTSTELVTIKDMLTHRIGTKTFQGDFTFWNSKLSREDIMRRMQYLKPVSGFRDAYGYCNSCFLTAGQVVEKVSGKKWEQYVTDKILKPLQMNNSYSSSNGIQNKVKNMATPYTTSYTNRLIEVPYDIWDNLGPAASIVSNVSDMSHWLQFQLDSGVYKNKRIMPWEVLQRTRDVQISTGSRKSGLLPIHFRGYGLGLFVADYNGKQIYWHTGGAAGMVSNVCFVPEENLGICILTNNDNQNFFEALRYQILDAYLGVAYVNRSQQQLPSFNKGMKEQVEQIEGWQKIVEDVQNGPDTTVAGNDKYIGTYSNKLYGTIIIRQSRDYGYVVDFSNHPNLTASLKTMGQDNWLLEYENIEYGVFKTNFTFNNNGTVKSVFIKANEFVEYDPYEFVKIK